MFDNSLLILIFITVISIIIDKISSIKKIIKDTTHILIAVISLLIMYVSIFNLRYGFIEVILFSISYIISIDNYIFINNYILHR